jgi:hypothetical protein
VAPRAGRILPHWPLVTMAPRTTRQLFYATALFALLLSEAAVAKVLPSKVEQNCKQKINKI